MTTEKKDTPHKKWNSYQDYLKSPEWAAIRTDVRRRDGKMCACCRLNPSGCCHHLQYPNDWNDDSSENVVFICEVCHKRFHDEYGVIQVKSREDFHKIIGVLIRNESRRFFLRSFMSEIIIDNKFKVSEVAQTFIHNRLTCGDEMDKMIQIGSNESCSINFDMWPEYKNDLLETVEIRKILEKSNG